MGEVICPGSADGWHNLSRETGVCTGCGMVDPGFTSGMCEASVMGIHKSEPSGVCRWCDQVVNLPLEVEAITRWTA